MGFWAFVWLALRILTFGSYNGGGKVYLLGGVQKSAKLKPE